MTHPILAKFRKVVTPKFVLTAAKKHKFTQRSTAQVMPMDFIRALLTKISTGSELTYSSLNAALRKVNHRINISDQALADYFYKQSTVNFIRSLYEKILEYQREKIMRNISSECDVSYHSILSYFDRILLEDSTICTLNDKLQGQYPGSGGTASRSSLKIDLVHELKSATILDISVSHGNKPDVASASSILDTINENDLVLRDLGYHKLDAFAQIVKKGAFFISRLYPRISIYLNDKDEEPIDLGRYLKKKHAKKNVIDLTVYLGKSKERMRLIAYRLSDEISQERRRKAKRKATSKGRKTTEGYLNLLDYVIIITNIPQEMIQASVIGTIYRIRWNIELIFKTWKSQLCLQINLKGFKATRIECILYITLIIVLLTSMVHKWLKSMGLDKVGKEISLEKLVKLLMGCDAYVRLLFNSVRMLENEIKKCLRNIKKQKRKRKTTLERVVFQEGYPEKYIVVNI